MCIIVLFLSSFLFLWSQLLYTMDEKPAKKPQEKPHQQQFSFSVPAPKKPTPRQKEFSVPSPRSTPPKKDKEEMINLHYKPHKRHLRSDTMETDIPHIDKGKQELPPPQKPKPFVSATINREKSDEIEPPRHTFLQQESRSKRPTLFSLPLTKRKSPDSSPSSSKPSSRNQSPRKTSDKSKQDTQTPTLPTISPRKSPKRSSLPISFSPHTSSHESPHKSSFRNQSPSKASPKEKPMSDDYLIKAVQKGKTKIIQAFLDNENNDPNQQSIGPKNTLLHLAVLYDKKNPGKSVSILFLTNPRVNSLIKNIYNCAPYQCIAKEEIRNHTELYEALKLRATLDHIVNALLMTDLKMIEKNNAKETVLTNLSVTKETIIKKLQALVLRVQNIIPLYANAKFIFALMKSRIAYNFPSIVMLIRNREIDPNTQDDWGNTCLHDAVYLRDKHILLAYLQNPTVNSLIKNSENLLAHQLISTTDEQYSELRRLLFARNSLDFWIKEQFPHFLFLYPENRIAKLDDSGFQTLIKKIKDTSERINNRQKDQDETTGELPEETIYPEYAHEQFLLDRFNAYKKNEKIVGQRTLVSQLIPDISVSYVEESTSHTEKSTHKSNQDILNEILFIELDSSSTSHVSHADK